MGKVQFNCRLDDDIAEWIATESAIQTKARGAKFSQADVVSLLVNEVQNDREVQAVARTSHMRPPKLTKKEQVVAELAASDLTAQAAGRDNIEYGTHDIAPRGQHIVNLDAVANAEGSKTGKASTEVIIPQNLDNWRRNRAPIPKPKDRK